MGTHGATGSEPTPAEDRQAIIDVTIAYCWTLDENRWEDLDEVFLPDATAHFGDRTHEGLDEIRDKISRSLGHLDDSQHMISNHQVTIDGDTATCRCYLHAQHVKHSVEGSPLYVVAGRYEDRLERTPNGWRIRHRSLVPMWTEGNREVARRPD